MTSRIAVYLLAAAVGLAGQQLGKRQDPHGDLPSRIESGALTVAPEIGADILLQAAVSPNLSRKWRVQLAEDAIALSPQIAESWPKTRAFSGPTDSVASLRARAWALDLDRLSVRLRAIEILTRLDRRSVMSRLGDLGFPKFPPESCSDSFTYNLTAWFQVIGQVAEGFVRSDDRLEFLAPYIRSISTPAQLAPAAHLITQQPEALRMPLALELAHAVDQIHYDPRQTTWSLRPTMVALEALNSACSACAVRALKAYRDYLESSLKAGFCADTWGANTEFGMLERANSILVKQDIAPLTLDSTDARVGEVGGNLEQVWSEPSAAALLTSWRALRDQAKAANVTIDRMALERYLQQAAHWIDPGGKGETTLLVRALSLLAPLGFTKGDLHAECAHAFISFLDSEPARESQPTLWLSLLKMVPDLDSTRAVNSDVASALTDASSQELYMYRLVFSLKDPTARP